MLLILEIMPDHVCHVGLLYTVRYYTQATNLEDVWCVAMQYQ